MKKALICGAIASSMIAISACKDSSGPSEQSSSSTLSSSLQPSSSSEVLSSSSTVLSSSSIAVEAVTPPLFPAIVKAFPVDTSKWLSNAASKVSIAPWQGFRKGAWALTFDDGLNTNFTNVKPILDKYNLKATFFVITHTLAEAGQPKGGRAGSWDQFQQLANEGHEIGGHTQDHPKLTEEDSISLTYQLDSAAADIIKRIPNNKILTMATPYCASNSKVRLHMGRSYIANRDVGNPSSPAPSTLLKMGASIITYDKISKDSNRTLEGDMAKMAELQKTIETYVIGMGKWSTYLAHEIVPFDSAKIIDAYYPVSSESFDAHAAWLKGKMDAGELWVAPMGTLARYFTESSLAKFGFISETDTEIRMVIDDGLNDQDYNVELSVEISLPSTWTNAKITQAGQSIASTVVNGKIRFNVIPSSKELVFSK